MARLLGNEGFIMNQSNGNAYMRVYSRGKTDVGPFLTFDIAGGNPNLHVIVKTYFCIVQTNGVSDWNSAVTRWNALWVDTGGNTYGYEASFWSSGNNIGMPWSTSYRQAKLCIWSTNNGGFPGKASICSEIYCDRWDYLSVSNSNY